MTHPIHDQVRSALEACGVTVPEGTDLQDYLGHLAWPAGVHGCALAVERRRAAQPDARPQADEPDTDPLPVIPTPVLQEPR